MSIQQTHMLSEARTASYTATVYRANVRDFGAVADGKTDSTQAFQAAIDAVAEKGGGVLFVPAGQYAFFGSLTVRQKVLLAGEYDASAPAGGPLGTVLCLYDRTASFLRLDVSSGVRHLAFWYPEQSLDAVIPYPAAIQQCGTEIVLAEELRFINAYEVFDFADPAHPNSLQTVRGITGTVLHRFLKVDRSWDITRVEDVRLSPEYWAASGLPGAPGREALAGYTRAHAIGIEAGMIDWYYFTDLTFVALERGLYWNGSNNGQLFALTMEDCTYGMVAEKTNGIGSMMNASRIDARRHALWFPARYTRAVYSFSDCTFSGDAGAVRMDGDGALMLSRCTVIGGDAPAVTLAGGTAALADCALHSSAGAPLALGGAVKKVYLTGEELPDYSGEVPPGTVVTAPPLGSGKRSAYPSSAVYGRRRLRPAGQALITVPPGEEDTDCAPHLQRAINEAAEAGGGTVCLLPGSYRVDSPVTVKSGVELRGGVDVPVLHGHVTWLSVYGLTADSAPAFILEPHSGIVGLSLIGRTDRLPAVSPRAPLIQGRGEGVYVVNTTLQNGWTALDLGSYCCDRAYVDSVNIGTLHEGIRVGNSRGVVIRDVQMNNNSALTPLVSPECDDAALRHYLATQVTAFSAENAEVCLYNCFCYGADVGLRLSDGARVFATGLGVDNGRHVIEAHGDAQAQLCGTESTCINGDDRCVICTGSDFTGRLTLRGISSWGDYQTWMKAGGGTVEAENVMVLAIDSPRLLQTGGDVTLRNLRFWPLREEGTGAFITDTPQALHCGAELF